MRDKGVRTQCAEEDNVYVVMSQPAVRRFTVTARHPVYGAALKADNSEADYVGCAPMTGAHDYPFDPRTRTLYEDDHVLVKGVVYPGYWRPEQVPVRVGKARDAGFHLIQLFLKRGGDAQEVLVLHAADGYWRARPLPLPQFGRAAYGSSFLVGPIEESSRPFVRIARLVIDPRRLTFHAVFVKGGEATVRVVAADRRQVRLAVTLSPRAAAGPMFAAVRSMYVSPLKADAARLDWRDASVWRTAPVVGFGAVTARAVTFDRVVPSGHNTSAPDLLFEGFDSGS
ncbi:MAG: hypothetical protein WDN45_04230 [Caulobacteraceae bacterium]